MDAKSVLDGKSEKKFGKKHAITKHFFIKISELIFMTMEVICTTAEGGKELQKLTKTCSLTKP